MRFEFRNFGIIEKADIELNGLTVLTGINDSGKSFIGKGIFSIIKTITNSDQYYYQTKATAIIQIFNQIYTSHRQLLPFTAERNQKFDINSLTARIREYIQSNRSEYLELIKSYKEAAIEDINVNAKPYTEARINQVIGTIEKYYSEIIEKSKEEDNTEEKKYKFYFDKVILERYFQLQFNNLHNNSICEIDVKEGETKLLEIKIENNSTKEFNYLNPVLQDNCTILETPIILQLKTAISNSLRLFPNSSGVMLHYEDLFDKIDSSFISSSQNKFEDIYNEISKIINGNLVYKQDDRTINFLKNDAIVRTFNIATGIKSLGTLQLLIQSGKVNSNSILIIDEPEIHLHPHWEIIYAKIIVLLAKASVPILISTHSPYFIKALTVYSKKHELGEDKVRVYFSEKNEQGLSTFKNISTDLTPFLDTLAEPMQTLFLESN